MRWVFKWMAKKSRNTMEERKQETQVELCFAEMLQSTLGNKVRHGEFIE